MGVDGMVTKEKSIYAWAGQSMNGGGGHTLHERAEAETPAGGPCGSPDPQTLLHGSQPRDPRKQRVGLCPLF